MRSNLKWRGCSLAGDGDGKKNYVSYDWTVKEICWEVAICAATVLLFSWFFYRSAWALGPMLLVGVLGMRKRYRDKVSEARRRLVLQFQECIQAVSASLHAGYSVENAFLECWPDMRMMFGEESFICRELAWIRRGLVMNITLEELLNDLGRRSHAEEIREFAEVFTIAKRNGGNIPEIIRSSEEVIRSRAEIEEEIRIQMASRKLEQKVMNVMPFGILIYIESSSPGYFDTLYHNFTGILVMTGCLAAYVFSCGLSDRILGRTAAVWGKEVRVKGRK